MMVILVPSPCHSLADFLQVRHKKTFLHLEQLIIKHHQHTQTVAIKSVPGELNHLCATKWLYFLIPHSKMELTSSSILAPMQSISLNFSHPWLQRGSEINPLDFTLLFVSMTAYV
jgi:hypothetical protein